MGCGTAIFECNELVFGKKVDGSHFGQKKDWVVGKHDITSTASEYGCENLTTFKFERRCDFAEDPTVCVIVCNVSGTCAGHPVLGSFQVPLAAVCQHPLQHLETPFKARVRARFKEHTAHTVRSRDTAPCFPMAFQPPHAFDLCQSVSSRHA